MIVGIASSQTDSSSGTPTGDTASVNEPAQDPAEETSTTTTQLLTETSQPTTSPTTTPAASSPDAIDVDGVSTKLSQLRVADPAPDRAPYDRNEYQPGGWGDLNSDCISTRHDLLAEQSQVPVTWTSSGCSVASGAWIDRYTGETLSTVEAATIDHHVALAEAHRSGGWRWDLDTKVRFTNDPGAGQLTIVGSAINQSKSDKRPDQWLPPDPTDHCDYVARWVNVKHRWQLTVTEAELTTIESIVNTCASATSTAALVGTAPPLIVTSTTAPATTTTIQVDTAAPGSVSLVACERRAETVTLANEGGSPADLSGYTLHDEGDKHRVSLGQFGSIQPGDTLTIRTGPDAVVGEGEVVWKRQHVWNNDGDTAFLIAPDGTQVSTRC